MCAESKFVVADQSGYTGYANVIAVPDYMNFRRFKVLRVRMLLRQQFKIERMEKQLSELDQVDRENNALWLNSQKMDGNQERERLFEELNTAMASYGMWMSEKKKKKKKRTD